MAGIRDSKTANGITYHYDTLNGKVVRQTWTQNGKEKVFDIIYDAGGQPYACVYEGYRYYYVLNQQGDVIQIVGSEGTVCAEYRYDAWGNVLSITGLYAGTLGAVNPIRYRGYYYDAETGFYYLQSRYYDPCIGRHLNSDTVFDYDTGFPGYNLFAYCGNCPVFRIDCCGRDSGKCDDVNEFDQMEELGSGSGNPMPLPANGSSGGGIWDSLKNSMKNAMSGLEMAVGEREGIELHHFLTNKSQTYTDDFAEKAARYQLDLDDDWNTEVLINHRGRHTNAYHDYMGNHLDQVIAVAKDDPALFLEGFGILRQSVIDNPGLLYARYLK